MKVMIVHSNIFGLLRHAPTLWNEKKIIQGQLDSQLSPTGKEKAAQWGKKLASSNKWQRILYSDLGRTKKTAELINCSINVPAHPDSRLREQDWGDWSGMTLAGVKKKYEKQLQQMIRSGWNFRPPNGESRKEVLKRCITALKDAQQSWPDESILIICHEGVIKGLIYHLMGRKFLPDEPPIIQSGHLHLIEQNSTAMSIKMLNHKQL